MGHGRAGRGRYRNRGPEQKYSGNIRLEIQYLEEEIIRWMTSDKKNQEYIFLLIHDIIILFSFPLINPRKIEEENSFPYPIGDNAYYITY